MTTFVPTERIIVRPDTQGTYSPATGGRRLIKFFIPPSVGCVDTVDLVLRSTITMSGSPGYARPNPRAGIGSLIRSLSIRSGSNNALIEQIDSYNGLLAATMGFETNESIANLRTLTEGVDGTPVNADTSAKNSIYWKPMATIDETPTPQPLLTEFPFHRSGILNPPSGKTFPVVATDGLRVEILLDEPNRSLLPYMHKPAGMTLAEDAQVDVKDFDSGKAIKTSVVQTANSKDFAMNGIRKGDSVSIKDSADVVRPLTVTGVAVDGSNLKLTLTLVTPVGASNSNKFAADAEIIFAAKTAGYELSDVALVMNKVTPPREWLTNIMRQVDSNDGWSIDFPTFSLTRTTLPASTGMLSQNIPAVHPEAYSILSVPYDSDKFNTLVDDSFKTDFSGAVSYQYFIDSEAVPNRAVPLNRLSRGTPIPEAMHLREQTKALQNSAIPVRNLVGCQTRSVIGRALSAQGQVADLSNGNTRLQTEYTQHTHELKEVKLAGTKRGMYKDPPIVTLFGGEGSATVTAEVDTPAYGGLKSTVTVGAGTDLLWDTDPGTVTYTFAYPPPADNRAPTSTFENATLSLTFTPESGKFKIGSATVTDGGFGFTADLDATATTTTLFSTPYNSGSTLKLECQVDTLTHATLKEDLVIVQSTGFTSGPTAAVFTRDPLLAADPLEASPDKQVATTLETAAETVSVKQYDHHICHSAQLTVAEGVVQVQH